MIQSERKLPETSKLGDAPTGEVSLAAIEPLLAEAQLTGQFCDQSPGLLLARSVRDFLLGEVLHSYGFLFF